MSPEQQPNHHSPENQANLSAELERQAIELGVERAVEHQIESTEHKSEKLSETREKIAEIQATAEVTAPTETAPTEPIAPPTKRQQKAVYRKTITEIRTHLTPSQRRFATVVHQPTVERASEILDKTVLRPSIAVGGTLGSLLFGGAMYWVARTYGYQLSGSEFILSLIVGGVIGYVVEIIAHLFGRKHKI